LSTVFSGIVQAVGRVVRVYRCGEDARIEVHAGALDLGTARVGDSIAVSGVCLTAVDLRGQGFRADVSAETLACTILGALIPGAQVNLEKAVTPSTPLGGHLVSGHVDGVGEVTARRSAGRSVTFHVASPGRLARYIAEKGSVCLDGVSLTVNEVNGLQFGVNIVPHTLANTTLGEWQVGSRVNLEVDIVARYLERLLLGERAAEPETGISRDFLAQHGFLRG
jgi:riboflavin synthase